MISSIDPTNRYKVPAGRPLAYTPLKQNCNFAFEKIEFTWRIIPISKWLITMVNKSPKDRVVGPLPNDVFMA